MTNSATFPSFFVFKQNFEYEQVAGFENFIYNFKDSFEAEQTHHWQLHWAAHGDDIVLQQWQEKYDDYLDDTTTGEAHAIAEPANEEDDEAWLDLWEEHSEEVYVEQYTIYLTVFNTYYWHLKLAIESSEQDEEEIEEDVFSEDEYEYAVMDEMEESELLGLPTAFGGRPQQNGKHKRNPRADYEDESHSLHHLESKIIAKGKAQKKAKKLNRMLRNVPAFMKEERSLLKYWFRRFSLFSRFDDGIQLDRESWFSVTPEKVAAHLAVRLASDVIIDGFCGCGGNAIQFALTCHKVIAIDIDPVKVAMARHNASIYGVAERIEFIVGDFLQLCRSGRLHADVAFLSPPWGGPKYKMVKQYDIEEFLLPVGATELITCARNISANVVLFLPRNADLKQIVKLAGAGQRCEVEHNYLDTRLVALTALYGERLVSPPPTAN